MKKIFSILIIGILVLSGLGTSVSSIENLFLNQPEIVDEYEDIEDDTTAISEFKDPITSMNKLRPNLRDILFNLKMSIFTKLALYPSLSACVIVGDEVIWSKGYGFYDL